MLYSDSLLDLDLEFFYSFVSSLMFIYFFDVFILKRKIFLVICHSCQRRKTPKGNKGSYFLGQKNEVKAMLFYLRQVKNSIKIFPIFIKFIIICYYINSNFISSLRKDQELVVTPRLLWQQSIKD